jgi:hypothetical protein
LGHLWVLHLTNASSGPFFQVWVRILNHTRG